jgi:hypothetical protein
MLAAPGRVINSGSTAEDAEWPYKDLDGARLPQLISCGEIDYLDLPTGEIVCPFE